MTLTIAELTQYGEIAAQAIEELGEHYDSMAVTDYVIMPNHIHLIIYSTSGGRLIVAPTVPTIIGQLKRIVSKRCGRSMWQKSFYGHVIRDGAEYIHIAAYIENNPINWHEDELIRTTLIRALYCRGGYYPPA